MKTMYLGKSGLNVSAIGMGCMGMSEFYGPSNDEKSTKLIHEAFELGVTHFDTADQYGLGHNEILVGNAVKNFRKEITIATKCGIMRDKNNPSFRGTNGTPDYIKNCCHESLKRLGTDYVDLFYLHRIDPATPIEVSVTAMAELVAEGKVRHIGLSEASADELRRAFKIHPLAAVQTELSLWTRAPAHNVLPVGDELGIGFVAYSPIGRGFLTGNIKSFDELPEGDFRRSLPRFQPENWDANFKLVTFIEELANEKRCTTAQIALAWVLTQGNVAAIPGMRQSQHLHDNIRAAEIDLNHDELALLNKIAQEAEPIGERYTSAAMQTYRLAE
jgi:aryl-alcohol dehydrogenase-like predicted oxidoreductase